MKKTTKYSLNANRLLEDIEHIVRLLDRHGVRIVDLMEENVRLQKLLDKEFAFRNALREDTTTDTDTDMDDDNDLWIAVNPSTEEVSLAESWAASDDKHRLRIERRSFEERRSFDDRRWTGRNDNTSGDRRRDFTPTHHGTDTL